MVRKSMLLLNKCYSSREDIFKKAVQAQVILGILCMNFRQISWIFCHCSLTAKYYCCMYCCRHIEPRFTFTFFKVVITAESIKVHAEIQKRIPLLKQISQAKIGDEQAKSVIHIMDIFTKWVQNLNLFIWKILAWYFWEKDPNNYCVPHNPENT